MILQYDFTISAKIRAWETLKKTKDSFDAGSVWILNMQMNVVDLWEESYMCNTKNKCPGLLYTWSFLFLFAWIYIFTKAPVLEILVNMEWAKFASQWEVECLGWN